MTTLSLVEWQTRSGVPLAPSTAATLRTAFRARVEPSLAQASGEPLWDVTPSGIVGALDVGADRVLVRPKTSVENVLFMLGVGSGRDPWLAVEDAHLARSAELTGAVAALFVRLVNEALSRGVLRGYRDERADLTTVRGRIDLAAQLRRRPGFSLPLAVAYDEHDENILENQLLVAAAAALRPVARPSAETSRGLHRMRALLSGVGLVDFRPTSVPTVTWTRLNAHYRPAVELARLVLGRSGLDVDQGAAKTLGITLEMAKLFEDFVCSALGRELRLAEGRTRTQDPWFLDEDGGVAMRPDLVWYGAKGGPRAVVDAKYKREAPGGYPDADIYQLLAYCTALDLADGHLVYAEGHEAGQHIRIVHDGPTIHAHALDLTRPPRALIADVASLAVRIGTNAERTSRRHRPDVHVSGSSR